MKTKRQHLDIREYQRLSLSCLNYLKQVLNPSWTIGTYMAFGMEVDTRPLFEMYSSLAIPKMEGKGIMHFYRAASIDDLSPNSLGILEPTTCLEEVTQVDVMIVPVVAYHREGYRLGMGGGYYDRYLTSHPCFTIGLAYTFQQCDTFDIKSHDVKLDMIITEKGVTVFNENYHFANQENAFR